MNSLERCVKKICPPLSICGNQFASRFTSRVAFLGARTILVGWLTLFFHLTSAHALIELKGGYSFIETSPTDINNLNSTAPKTGTLNAVSVDAMATVPMMPVGLGVRYESISAKNTKSSNDSSVNWSRVSILVNKRLVDTGLYFGPIATIGVSNDFKSHSNISGVGTDYTANGPISETLGLEAGAKLAIFRVGAEAGYMYAPLGKLKNSTSKTTSLTTSGAEAKADMSGPYFRLLVGLGF